MSLGEFFQKVLEWLYEFWPLRIVNAWEQGVRLRAGNPTKLLTSTNGIWGSGVHGFWPLLGEIITEDVNQCVIETSWQTIPTKDGHSISFSLAARYRIRDLVKLYTQIHEQEETIENQLCAAAGTAVPELNLDEIDGLPDLVQKEARKRLTEWGVTLLEVSIYNRVEAQTLRLMQE